MSHVANIAAYRFAALTDLQSLRGRLKLQCRAWQLKGTILLSTEGINLFIAGARQSVDALLAELRRVPGLADLQPRYSQTDHQPFSRMLVRVKKEIIAFGVPGIEPLRHTAPRLTPRELRRWLDEGRAVTLLDTRNDYEIKLGTFHNALPIGVNHFREFPAALAKLPAQLREQPVVTFCTGGIRCEKAAAYMQTQGFREVYQLDGGILKYFEDCGAVHYDGDCFVFDQRVGLDPQLGETAARQCFKCLAPLSEVEQQDPRYKPGESCPSCFRTPAELQAQRIAQRHGQIRRAMTPLPGSIARDNYRPITVSRSGDGGTLLEALCYAVRHLPPEHWQQRCAAGRVVNDRHEPVTADRIVRAGERYLHRFPQEIEPDVNAAVEVLYEDAALIVLNKPAPLPMHPAGRFNRNTLQYILNEVYRPQKPRPAHRLDANTTGLVVVARTRHFAGRLQPQFEAGQVTKHYLVRVKGHPAHDHFSCDAPIGVESGVLGTRCVDEQAGLAALTHFTVLVRNVDGTALLAARPATGRTNQIRIHCAWLGFPVCGDRAYPGSGATASAQTGQVDDPALCLHSWKMAFAHPATGQPLEFTAPDPVWIKSG
jgi:RluA family pseudouridine synthase